MNNLLTIAGSDSCGGAGIQADIKTFSALGCYAMSVITAVTAQNTQGVKDILNLPVDMIKKQLDAIFTDIEVDAVKIGMVSEEEIIIAISEKLIEYNVKNIVLDPVMISKSGFHLLNEKAKDALVTKLIPLATLVTPNILEAEEIIGSKIETIDDMEDACKKIYDMGAKNVLVKGGHLKGDQATDVLYDGEEIHKFTKARINTKNTHGTGCTLSSAIAVYIAFEETIDMAVSHGKHYTTGAIAHSLDIGKGVGPTNHFWYV